MEKQMRRIDWVITRTDGVRDDHNQSLLHIQL